MLTDGADRRDTRLLFTALPLQMREKVISSSRGFDREMLQAANKLPAEVAHDILRRIQRLKRMGITSTAAASRTLLDTSTSLQRKRSAAWLLSIVPDRSAARALIRVLMTSTDRALIWESAKALLAGGDKQLVSRLIGALKRARSKHGRSAAAWVLGNLRAKRSTKTLLQVAENTVETPDVRAHAAEAVGMIGDRSSVDRLITLLSDASPEVRFWSVYALGEIGDARALNVLRRLARVDRTVVPGWGAISKEALNAIKNIREGI